MLPQFYSGATGQTGRFSEGFLLRRLQIVRAFDVRGRKGLSVMPFDALAELEAQFGPVLAPRPARRQIGHDRLHAVLTHVLVEEDEVIGMIADMLPSSRIDMLAGLSR